MGQIASELTQSDSYLLEHNMSNLDESEAIYNSHLTFDVSKNVNGRTELDMSMRELRRVFSATFKRKNVDILKLNCNYLKALPYDMACMGNLKEIYLQHNNFQFVPVQLCSFKKLQVLDLSYNKLTSLPYAIGHLISLRKLDISYNKIISMPDSCQLLRQLDELNLDGNGLWEIPAVIFNIQNLQILKLQNNNLTYLPKSFSRLKNLQQLNLCDNHIKAIHIQLMNYLKQLPIFDMARNVKFNSVNKKNDTNSKDKTRKFSTKLITEIDSCKEYRMLPKLPNSHNICDKCHNLELDEHCPHSKHSLNSMNSSEYNDDVYVFTSYAFHSPPLSSIQKSAGKCSSL